jgi:hypothetical protein
LGHVLDWAIAGEDLPSETNRVELSDRLRDSSGFAAPRIVYRVDENTKRLFEWHVERAKESFTAAGASKVEALPLVPVATHLYGTARMGDDPARSVVNRWGIAHDVPNLAVVDGSVFVTSAGVNPTSTISALALRTADYLATHGSQIPRPEPGRMVALTRAQARGQADGAAPAEPPAAFEPAERERLAELADALIPPAHGKPAPSEVGIEQTLLDRVVAARPDLVTALHRALRPWTGDALARLRELGEEDAEARDALELTVAGGYYMSAEVRAVLGYPGGEPAPVRPGDYLQYVEEGLLDHLFRG